MTRRTAKRTKRSTKRSTKRNNQKGAGHGKLSRATEKARLARIAAKIEAERNNKNAMNIGPRTNRPTRKSVLSHMAKSRFRRIRKLNMAASRQTAAKNFSKTMRQQAAAQKEAKRLQAIAEEHNFANLFAKTRISNKK
jgi:hypothetical protein